ncbi:MAG TPA: GyrI-like domain-containing protein, partial [Anaerolineaceae bacterium]|nr:GyrI-like domain-containing protein [Anaerolineaceae bacterium]
MKETPVRIVTMEPMTLICFNGYGSEPENQALTMLHDWSKKHNQLGRIFGYNNPDPAEGSPNYGYDAGMVVDTNTEPVDGARLRHLEQGLYAVLNCPVKEPWVDIPDAWKTLVQWADANDYSLGSHQWLEEHLLADKNDPDVLFSL